MSEQTDSEFDAEVYGILCDFFERHVLQPGQLDPNDGIRHTSREARALALALERHLEAAMLSVDVAAWVQVLTPEEAERLALFGSCEHCGAARDTKTILVGLNTHEILWCPSCQREAE